MKKATEYAKRIRKLMTTIKPHASDYKSDPNDGLTDHVVRSVLIRYAGEAEGAAAFNRLRKAMVDLNELRVTPVAEVVDHITHSVPQARFAAESVTRTLRAIYNREHHLNLEHLRAMGKKESREYIESLDGMEAFSAALASLRGIGLHAVPLTDEMVKWLRENDMVDAEAEAHEIRAFVERTVPAGKGEFFYSGLSTMIQGAARKKRAASKKAAGKKAAPAAASRRTAVKKKSAAAGSGRTISRHR
jgi:hypothetical protein